MASDFTYISAGDFIDLFYKIKQKGYTAIVSKFHLSNQARVVSKWNADDSSSDFWIIPEVRQRWNEKCTGDPGLEYEDYVVNKYFSGSTGLKMLSVGCGSGFRERKFGKYPCFDLIDGIDIAARQVGEARKMAMDLNLHNLKYYAADFVTHTFEPGSYDCVLFNSSLHHFRDIHDILQNKVLPILKEGGLLIIFEYVGPKRLQWTKLQLEVANKLLKDLPDRYKKRYKSNSMKRRIYRPGLWRMFLVDPSEAVDSDAILPAIHQHFTVMEEKKIGWDILQLLLKDISHNFLEKDTETQSLLNYLFEKEDQYLSMTGRSDGVFGIYQK